MTYLSILFQQRVTAVPIENVGHAILPEQPQRVAKVIIAFINQVYQ